MFVILKANILAFHSYIAHCPQRTSHRLCVTTEPVGHVKDNLLKKINNFEVS